MGAVRHVPVMLEECLELLIPSPGRLIADLTLGGAGHTRAFLEAGSTVIGFDRDPAALARVAAESLPFEDRFVPVHRDFGSFPEVLDGLGHDRVDGVLMDLGLSSDQLDDPARGFAFRFDGPLDLRFDRDQGQPAYERIENADTATVVAWLRDFGEVRVAPRLGAAMVQRARAQELRTTGSLRELVSSMVPKRMRPEPELARVFQALRIVVNDELTQLERVLECLPDRLRPNGRFVAISYHSLEDRRVKRMLRSASGRAAGGSRHLPPPRVVEPTFEELTRKALKPSEEEIARNPRARSARLRGGRRL